MASFVNSLIWEEDDDVDAMEIIEFDIPRPINKHSNHFHDLADYSFFNLIGCTL